MANSQKPSAGVVLKAIRAAIVNGERILEETDDLEFRQPPSSRFFLIMIAQEEFAKAFILFLVKEEVILFTPPVLRAINDHACKQLVGVIMDYMIMHWENLDELKAAIHNDHDHSDGFPHDVGSAMELLCFEKVRRWESNNWFWVEDPNYATSALRIAKGKKDRRKQDALYVRIGRDGEVRSTPQTISADETCDELERARRYKKFVESILDGEAPSYRFDKAMAALKILFEWQRRSP